MDATSWSLPVLRVEGWGARLCSLSTNFIHPHCWPGRWVGRADRLTFPLLWLWEQLAWQAGLALFTKRTTPRGPVFTTTGSWPFLRSEACLGPGRDRCAGGNPRAWQEGSLAGQEATGLWRVEGPCISRTCVCVYSCPCGPCVFMG